MTDRGQLTTPRAVRLVVGGAVGVLVLAIVVEEMLSRVAAADGAVATCGLCHVDWRPAAALLVIGALVVIARWLLAPWPQSAGEGDSDD